MHIVRTLLLAAALLALTATNASAEALAVDDQRFDMEWSFLEFEAAGNLIRCPLTLSGSFHSGTFGKTANGLVGHITRTAIRGGSGAGECTGGRMTVLTGALPWHVTYGRFAGTLPRITRAFISIIGLAIQMQPTGSLTCLGVTTTTNPGVLWVELAESGVVRNINLDSGSEIPLTGAGGLCFFAGAYHWSGTGAISELSTTNVLTIVLTRTPTTPGRLTPSPSSVVVEQLEESDRFTVRNDGGSTVSEIRVRLEGVDVERPEFEARAVGCGSTIAVGASCTYTITVNDRPLRSGRVTLSYRNGIGGEASASVSVEIQGVDFEVMATPNEVAIEELEQNDIFAARNTGDATVTITRVEVVTADAENPDFTVTSPGCSRTMRVGEVCNYVIAVNARPDDDGRVTITYEDGSGATRSTVVGVDIGGEDPPPAVLQATPSSVSVERLESNDSFVVRNIGSGTATAEGIDVAIEAADRERPEFEVAGLGCTTTLLDGASCTYVVTVNSRPQREGYAVLDYRDGVGGTATLRVRIDIES